MAVQSSLAEYRSFFSDMYRQTVGKLTGILYVLLSVAPVVLPKFFDGDQGLIHNRALWEIAAAVAFFLAAKSAWAEKDKQLRISEERLRLTTVPDISILIQTIDTAKVNGVNTLLTLWLMAQNRGAESFLQFTGTTVQINGVEVKAKYFVPPTGTITLHGAPGNPDKVLLRDDNFLRKVVDKPVSRNCATVGWACFVIPGYLQSVVSQPETRVTVSFEDIAGTEIRSSLDFGNKSPWEKIFNPSMPQ